MEGTVYHEISCVDDNKMEGIEHTVKIATAMVVGIANEKYVILISYIRN